MMSETFTMLTTPEAVILAAAQREHPDGYEIQCHESSDDFDSLQRMAAQGIDSHLTAIRFDEFEGGHGRRGFRFDPESLVVLCRRLADSDLEEDYDLRSCILQTLDIEEI